MISNSVYEEYIKPFFVLFAICIAVAGLLGVTNHITAPITEANNNQAAINTRMELLPNATEFLEVECSYTGVSSFHVDQGGSGAVIVAAFKGYGGLVPVTVAVGPDGSITGIRADTSTETTNLGTKAGEAGYLQNFVGKNCEDFAPVIAALQEGASDTGDIDTIGGATYSSKAVINGVAAAMGAYHLYAGGAL